MVPKPAGSIIASISPVDWELAPGKGLTTVTQAVPPVPGGGALSYSNEMLTKRDAVRTNW
jgi:hypothetical protein